MNWFSGDLHIYHPDDAMGAPSYQHHALTLAAAQKIVDTYPHEIREVIYHPYCINLAST